MFNQERYLISKNFMERSENIILWLDQRSNNQMRTKYYR